MAFTRYINDLIRLLALVVLILPSIATNIDCDGKPFHCVNSTHFMICVDLGSGVSSTIDDFIIPCPPTTVCLGTNRFECEFPTLPSSTTVAPIVVPLTTSVSETWAETTPFYEVTTSIPFEEYYNTISTTTLSEDALLTQQPTVTESIPMTDATENMVVIPRSDKNSTVSVNTASAADVQKNVTRTNIDNNSASDVESVLLVSESINSIPMDTILSETTPSTTDFVSKDLTTFANLPKTVNFTVTQKVNESVNVIKSQSNHISSENMPSEVNFVQSDVTESIFTDVTETTQNVAIDFEKNYTSQTPSNTALPNNKVDNISTESVSTYLTKMTQSVTIDFEQNYTTPQNPSNTGLPDSTVDNISTESIFTDVADTTQNVAIDFEQNYTKPQTPSNTVLPDSIVDNIFPESVFTDIAEKSVTIDFEQNYTTPQTPSNTALPDSTVDNISTETIFTDVAATTQNVAIDFEQNYTKPQTSNNTALPDDKLINNITTVFKDTTEITQSETIDFEQNHTAPQTPSNSTSPDSIVDNIFPESESDVTSRKNSVSFVTESIFTDVTETTQSVTIDFEQNHTTPQTTSNSALPDSIVDNIFPESESDVTSRKDSVSIVTESIFTDVTETTQNVAIDFEPNYTTPQTPNNTALPDSTVHNISTESVFTDMAKITRSVTIDFEQNYTTPQTPSNTALPDNTGSNTFPESVFTDMAKTTQSVTIDFEQNFTTPQTPSNTALPDITVDNISTESVFTDMAKTTQSDTIDFEQNYTTTQTPSNTALPDNTGSNTFPESILTETINFKPSVSNLILSESILNVENNLTTSSNDLTDLTDSIGESVLPDVSGNVFGTNFESHYTLDKNILNYNIQDHIVELESQSKNYNVKNVTDIANELTETKEIKNINKMNSEPKLPPASIDVRTKNLTFFNASNWNGFEPVESNKVKNINVTQPKQNITFSKTPASINDTLNDSVHSSKNIRFHTEPAVANDTENNDMIGPKQKITLINIPETVGITVDESKSNNASNSIETKEFNITENKSMTESKLTTTNSETPASIHVILNNSSNASENNGFQTKPVVIENITQHKQNITLGDISESVGVTLNESKYIGASNSIETKPLRSIGTENKMMAEPKPIISSSEIPASFDITTYDFIFSDTLNTNNNESKPASYISENINITKPKHNALSEIPESVGVKPIDPKIIDTLNIDSIESTGTKYNMTENESMTDPNNNKTTSMIAVSVAETQNKQISSDTSSTNNNETKLTVSNVKENLNMVELKHNTTLSDNPSSVVTMLNEFTLVDTSNSNNFKTKPILSNISQNIDRPKTSLNESSTSKVIVNDTKSLNTSNNYNIQIEPAVSNVVEYKKNIEPRITSSEAATGIDVRQNHSVLLHDTKFNNTDTYVVTYEAGDINVILPQTKKIVSEISSSVDATPNNVFKSSNNNGVAIEAIVTNVTDETHNNNKTNTIGNNELNNADVNSTGEILLIQSTSSFSFPSVSDTNDVVETTANVTMQVTHIPMDTENNSNDQGVLTYNNENKSTFVEVKMIPTKSLGNSLTIQMLDITDNENDKSIPAIPDLISNHLISANVVSVSNSATEATTFSTTIDTTTTTSVPETPTGNKPRKIITDEIGPLSLVNIQNDLLGNKVLESANIVNDSVHLAVKSENSSNYASESESLILSTLIPPALHISTNKDLKKTYFTPAQPVTAGTSISDRNIKTEIVNNNNQFKTTDTLLDSLTVSLDDISSAVNKPIIVENEDELATTIANNDTGQMFASELPFVDSPAQVSLKESVNLTTNTIIVSRTSNVPTEETTTTITNNDTSQVSASELPYVDSPAQVSLKEPVNLTRKTIIVSRASNVPSEEITTTIANNDISQVSASELPYVDSPAQVSLKEPINLTTKIIIVSRTSNVPTEETTTTITNNDTSQVSASELPYVDSPAQVSLKEPVNLTRKTIIVSRASNVPTEETITTIANNDNSQFSASEMPYVTSPTQVSLKVPVNSTSHTINISRAPKDPSEESTTIATTSTPTDSFYSFVFNGSTNTDQVFIDAVTDTYTTTLKPETVTAIVNTKVLTENSLVTIIEEPKMIHTTVSSVIVANQSETMSHNDLQLPFYQKQVIDSAKIELSSQYGTNKLKDQNILENNVTATESYVQMNELNSTISVLDENTKNKTTITANLDAAVLNVNNPLVNLLINSVLAQKPNREYTIPEETIRVLPSNESKVPSTPHIPPTIEREVISALQPKIYTESIEHNKNKLNAPSNENLSKDKIPTYVQINTPKTQSSTSATQTEIPTKTAATYRVIGKNILETKPHPVEDKDFATSGNQLIAKNDKQDSMNTRFIPKNIHEDSEILSVASRQNVVNESWRATVTTEHSIKMTSPITYEQPLTVTMSTSGLATEPRTKISQKIDVPSSKPHFDIELPVTENIVPVSSSILVEQPWHYFIASIKTPTIGPYNKIMGTMGKVSSKPKSELIQVSKVENVTIIIESPSLEVTSTQPILEEQKQVSETNKFINHAVDPSYLNQVSSTTEKIKVPINMATDVPAAESNPKSEYFNIQKNAVKQTLTQKDVQSFLDLNSKVVHVITPKHISVMEETSVSTSTRSGTSDIPKSPHKFTDEQHEKTQVKVSLDDGKKGLENSPKRVIKNFEVKETSESENKSKELEVPENINDEQSEVLTMSKTKAFSNTLNKKSQSEYQNESDEIIYEADKPETVDSRIITKQMRLHSTIEMTTQKVDDSKYRPNANIEQITLTKKSKQANDAKSPDFKQELVQGISIESKSIENINTNIENSTAHYALPTKSLFVKDNTPVETLKTKEKSRSFVCEENRRGRFSDSKDCRKFYICIGRSEPIEGICPNNTVFSELRKQCTKNLSQCIRNNQFQCVSEGRFTDYLNDNIYYICMKNNKGKFIRFKLQCLTDYHLNKASVRCVFNTESNHSTSDVSKEQSNQSASSSKSEKLREEHNKNKKFECKKEGKFPEANDCRKYYVCKKTGKSQYRLRHKKCDSDELYDKDKKRCVDADSYECS